MKHINIFKILFLLLLINIVASVKGPECTPMGGSPCQVYNDCCRGLTCQSYASKCVMMSGVILPGQDTRPIGPGPYPPNIRIK